MWQEIYDKWSQIVLKIPRRVSGQISPWHPPSPPQSVGTDLGLCGIWMLLICPFVIRMSHVTGWVTQSRAWGTSARLLELPTCLDPCLNRDSMTQRQGRVVLSVWLVSSSPGSSRLGAQRPSSQRHTTHVSNAPQREPRTGRDSPEASGLHHPAPRCGEETQGHSGCLDLQWVSVLPSLPHGQSEEHE